MPCLAQLWIHPSQFPDQLRRDLLDSLRSRALNHKFLYDGLKQTRKWLALHQACSPSRTDPDCAAAYDQAFRAAATRLSSTQVHLVGLGCGGGQKDTRCLQILRESGKRVSYTPADVSAAMVLTARQCAMDALPELACTPLVCDLATATDLRTVLDSLAPRDSKRLLTFFGMIPNFEPDVILPRLASLLGPGALLLLSANLAPGPDYAQGMQRILPLYDNEPTRDWLLAFLLDLGVEMADGNLAVSIEDTKASLKRIVARFRFSRDCQLQIDSEKLLFRAGESLRLLFSYRYTPALIPKLLGKQGLEVLNNWISSSDAEGVFLIENPQRMAV